jgi:large subunit ribosomal protein L16
MSQMSPKRTKFRKQQKGKNRGIAWTGSDVSSATSGCKRSVAASSLRARSKRAAWRFSGT